MSILIKGIKMPKCCADCPCFYDFISCQALFDGTDDFSMSGFDEFKERLPNCPLAEVPTPHGRLIDADALIKHMKRDPLFPLVDRYGVTNVIQAASTIIEAEEVDA